MISAERLSRVFVEVADSLVADFDLLVVLQSLTDHAAAVSGAASVGLMLSDHRGRLRFMASSDETGHMLELLQIQTDEGPCVDCVRTGRPVVNADLAGAEGRWPTFAPTASAAGYESVHALPLRLRDQVVGALNLFGRDRAHFDDDEVRIVQALADVATIALLQERAAGRVELLTEQVEGVLNDRVVVEQAIGVLTHLLGVDPPEAARQLRERARASGQRLSQAARLVVEQFHGT